MAVFVRGCVHMNVVVCGGQQRLLGRLERQVVVSHLTKGLGTELGFLEEWYLLLTAEPSLRPCELNF